MFGRTAIVILLAVVASACGGATPAATRIRSPAPPAADITEETYDAALRTYEGLPVNDPAREEWLQRLVGWLARSNRQALLARDYDAIVEAFAQMTTLFGPEDFSGGHLAIELEPYAEALVQLGSPHGDEARVLSALLVLHALDEAGQGLDMRYAQASAWGREARSTLPHAVERFSRLIRVWEEHARLTPAREVLDFLAQLYAQRRNRIARELNEGSRLFADPSWRAAMANAPVLMRRTPLDVAAVYLQHGDVGSAVARVEQMGSLSQEDAQVAELLRDMQGSEAEANDAMLEIAGAYRTARPEVAHGICRAGHRRNPADARFVVCLARVAAIRGEAPMAVGWFADAIRLQPDARELYDEALEHIDHFIEQDGAGAGAGAGPVRALASEAERILEERAQRWPSAGSETVQARLDALVGAIEAGNGNLGEARQRLERSLSREDSFDALWELGVIEARVGDARRGVTLFRRALDEIPADAAEGGNATRANVLEQLGQAFHRAGDAEQGDRMYAEALRAWDGEAARLGSRGSALALARRGVLLDRLGRRPEAQEAFMRATEATPQSRELFATILAHLVSAAPDANLAEEVFRRALRQTALTAEWKTYFALWVLAIAARAGAAPSAEAQAVLQEVRAEEGWWGTLAQLALGTISHEAALWAGSGRGQRAEADFYEAMRLLGLGVERQADARALLERVVQSDLISYYEFTMAQAILGDAT